MITPSDYLASLDRTEHMLENGGATAVKVLMRDIRPVNVSPIALRTVFELICSIRAKVH